MKTATIKDVGGLRTLARHERSGTEIYTDAPVDNHGRGEAFSPTDLLASGLVSCMISIMAIRAGKSGLNMGNVEGWVEKIMAENPRRITRLNVEITFRDYDLTDAQKELLEKAALTCPVAQSLHPDITVETRFLW